MKKASKPRKLYRSAKTGRFTSKANVKRHPKTTVVETVKSRRCAR